MYEVPQNIPEYCPFMLQCNSSNFMLSSSLSQSYCSCPHTSPLLPPHFYRSTSNLSYRYALNVQTMKLSQSASPHNMSHTLNTLSVSICSCLHTSTLLLHGTTFLRKPTPNNSQIYAPNECPNHLYLPRLTTSALDKSKAGYWRLSLPGCTNSHCVFYHSTILYPHISPSYCTLCRLCRFLTFVDHVSTP